MSRYRLRVLMLGWEFPPHINGGMGVACYEISKHLQKYCDIQLVLPNLENTLSHEHSHIKIDSMGVPVRAYDNINLSVQRQVLDFTQLVYEKYKFYEFDVIYAHDWLTTQAAILLKQFCQKPMVLHIHSTEFDRSIQKPLQDIIGFEQTGLMHADMVITVSHYTKQKIMDNFSTDASKIKVFHLTYPSDCGQFAVESRCKRKKYVTFVGRLTAQKGPFNYLQMVRKILKIRDDIHFLIAGDGDLKPDMVEYIAKYRLHKHVHFLGFLNRVALNQVLQQSSVFVMPSISEPFGLVAMEALACGTPIIISSCSGVSEVFFHVLTIAPHDIDKWVLSLLFFLDSPVAATDYVKHLKQMYKGPSWQACAQSIYHVLNATSKKND
jgi:glycogen(starch) synthase